MAATYGWTFVGAATTSIGYERSRTVTFIKLADLFIHGSGHMMLEKNSDHVSYGGSRFST
jgi:hypothetical protein